MGNISKLTPILYDKGETNFNHNGLGKLTKLLVNEIDEALNGEFEAFFEYPANGHLADKIDNEMYIKAKPNKKDEPHVFKVYDYEIDTFTQTYLIYARSKNIEDLRNNVVLDVNVRDLAPTQAWSLAKNNALDPVVTTFYSDVTTTSSVHWERRSLLSTIAGQEGSMIQYWGGEIKHGINRISLLRRRGQDNVTTVRHGKNLDGLKATYSTKGLVTAIVPYYVKDDDKAVYGDVVESEYINNYPSTYYDVIEYNDEELGLTQEDEPESGWEDSAIRTELNRVAKRYFDENVGKDLPSINMEISLEDISQTKEYENFKDFEQIEIGDTITVYSKKFGLNINAKVRRVVYNGLTDKNELVEVGTARRSLYDDVRDEFKKVEIELKEGIDHAMASADGKNTIYHGTADPNEVGLVGKNNDTYFRTNGQFKEIWSYLDGQWHLEVGDLTGEQIKADIAEQQQEIEEAKRVADDAVNRIDNDIANKFTSIDEEILAIEGISNSTQANAQTALTQSIDALSDASLALTNSQTAINTAGSAISSIQDINMEIDEINGTLAIKADSSTVNALDGVVSNLSTEVGIIAGELSLKANSSTVDTLTGRVSTAETGITANANAIQLKASQSSVDTLTGRVNTLGAQIDVTAGQISSKVWSTDIQTAVDGIEIGGRNLLLNSYSLEMTGSDSGNRNVSTFEGGVHIITPTNNGNVYNTRVEPSMELVKGHEYTLSFDVLTNTAIGVYWYANINGSAYSGGRVPDTKGEWIKHEFTYTQARDSFNGKFLFGFSGLIAGSEVKYKNLKLEKGNKATDWTPAPEDTDAKISHIETEWTQTFDTFSQTVAGIDGRVTSQKQTIDSISSTVSGHENRISTVEQTASGLQSTVADKASQSQVTQLANGLSSVVKDLDDLEIGGRNLYLDSGRKITSSAYSIATYNFASKPIAGEKYTLSIKGKINPENHTGFYTNIFDGSAYPMMAIVGPEDLGSDGVYRKTFTMPHLADYISTLLYSYPLGTYVEASVEWIKFEKGNKATDWTPAPEDTQSQISQLSDNINLRVTKGELLSQINIEAGRTLIQSDRLLLNANNTVITGTAWMDGAVIANASIDGAKIADATIGSAKIASLDVSKISGNKAEFITASFNGINSSIKIDADGIYMSGFGFWRRTYLTPTGFDMYNEGGNNKSGAIGYFKPTPEESRSDENIIEGKLGHRHTIGIAANSTHNVAIGYGGVNSRSYKKAINIDGTDGLIRIYTKLSPRDSDYQLRFTAYDVSSDRGTAFITDTSGIMFARNGTKIWDESGRYWDNYNMTNRHRIGFFGNSGIRSRYNDSSMEIWSGGGAMFFYTGHSTLMMALRANLDMETGINMKGYSITNQSDRRLKKGITETNLDSLGAVKSWNIVDYEWEHGAGPEGRKVGMIAQDTPELSVINTDSGYYSIDASKQLMMTTHAVQQLAFKHDETNELAGQAYFLAETLADKMERLENRIEELERNVA